MTIMDLPTSLEAPAPPGLSDAQKREWETLLQSQRESYLAFRKQQQTLMASVTPAMDTDEGKAAAADMGNSFNGGPQTAADASDAAAAGIAPAVAAQASVSAPSPGEQASLDRRTKAFEQQQEADASGNFKRVRDKTTALDADAPSDDQVEAELAARLQQVRAAKPKTQFES